MSETTLIFKQEFSSFIKSGKSSLLLVFITALTWGGMISSKISSFDEPTSYLWIIFFAMVASAGLTNSVFVRERLSNTLEILLTTGLNRSSILYGKLLFTSTATLFIGVCALLTATLFAKVLSLSGEIGFYEISQSVLLYLGATLLVTSSSAFLSLALSNPRLVQLINFTTLTLFSITFTFISMFVVELPLHSLSISMAVGSLLFTLLAKKWFNSEKVIQPLIY